MQLYNRGIRRRLAPMLGGDRRRIQLAMSLLLTLPCTPMLQYGDEIGIWDDLSLPERECARTAMQWSGDRYGGFSTASKPIVPIIDDGEHGFRKVNVADQRRDPESLLNWTERRIRMRKELPEIGWGECTVVEAGAAPVLALRYTWRNTALQLQRSAAGGARRGRHTRRRRAVQPVRRGSQPRRRLRTPRAAARPVRAEVVSGRRTRHHAAPYQRQRWLGAPSSLSNYCVRES
jgi:hypothetical protein